MKNKLFAIIMASAVCLLAFAGCNKSNDAAADNAKAPEAAAEEAPKADEAKADEAKPADEAKADEAKPAEDAKADAADPSIEDVCKHTASCFEDSNVEQCIGRAKAEAESTKCPNEFKAMQKCMFAASCDDIKADNACKAENAALLECTGNSAKE